MVFVSATRPPSPPFEPVRLIAPDRAGPFVPGRETALAKVAGHGLEALEIRDGDHVVLVRRDHAEHGDLAAVLDDRGQATLWKVYPEPDALRLSSGRPGAERRIRPPPRIQGVVVAVLRRGLG
jgi:SOS-response transcriptional repressor LexA